MCGGSGYVGPSPSRERLSAIEREWREEEREAQFRGAVNELLQDVLAEANQRDPAALQEHLSEVRKAAEDLLEDSIELRFGGSVSKHTYVDGLSDVDLLLLVKKDVAQEKSPKELIHEFAQTIRERMPDAEVTTGDLSIKVRTPDGMEIQLLPAYKTANGFRIARPNGETWSDVINPKAFATRLTEVNQSSGGKVVPAIKLYKIAQQAIPERARLRSYHIEALAVDAFEKYDGPLDKKSMFLHLAKHAAERITRPMEETTGQSAYVDIYLGVEGSEERKRAADHIRRLHTRLERAADETKMDPWKEAFQSGER